MSDVEKRFKILALLCMELGVLEEKMQELACAIDSNHPQHEEALSYYENKIIEAYSE